MTIRVRFPTPKGIIEIGEGLPTYLISEIGLNHNGSEELAREMIYQSALSGATFVKFQKRSPSDLATSDFLDAPFEKCPVFGSTQREVRERLELPLDVYIRLREYAESLGLVFFASAFDLPSLHFLFEAGVNIIKIASHSLTNGPLLEELAERKTPVIASLGGTTNKERDMAVEILKENPMVLLHCVSAYPTPDSLVKLDTIEHLKQRYNVPVGFSSHEVGIDVSVAASLLGACMIERHFTLKTSMVGLDHSISLEPEEFSKMANKINRLRHTRGKAGDIQEVERVARNAYHVAICASEKITQGSTITKELLSFKQPLTDSSVFFTGMELLDLLDSIARVDLYTDEPISRDSVDLRSKDM
jgi:sialic acid synthase